ncbi:Fic family protein [Burkholderia gladioli]|uniref:Fic family protein n=1 Tax=Burkholderia gladioli TaxID=28095 RepID=UPI00163F6CCD|nr:Fic family protein [Burkholderia gladioli]
MILFDLVGDDEDHPAYEKLTLQNGARQYDFLKSVVEASIEVGRPFLSTQVIKALNYHAIACLHAFAGEYRPCQVRVGPYLPPPEFRVQALMDDMVNSINRNFETGDPVMLAAFALWKLNHIHPFINGNGRTARAVCYFILCIKARAWLPGSTILPKLIKRDRARSVIALRHADTGDMTVLHALLSDLLYEQFHDRPPENGGEWDVAIARAEANAAAIAAEVANAAAEAAARAAEEAKEAAAAAAAIARNAPRRCKKNLRAATRRVA